MRLSPVCTAIDSTCLPLGSGEHCCGIAERRLRWPSSDRLQESDVHLGYRERRTVRKKERWLPMKNVYEVLRQKELEVSRLEEEVEALRVVAPLLSEGE